MGVFSRMTDIVQANINAILDKAEDPEKVLRLIVQEMEETLVELRSVAARNIADKKDLTRKSDDFKTKVDQWQQKAELAIAKGREDLAKAALVEKHKNQQQQGALQSELDVIEESLAHLQQDTNKLQEKMAEAQAKQKSLAIRQQSAAVRLKSKVKQESHNIDQTIARFESYERRIDDLEAQVDAYDLVNNNQTLSAQFDALQTDDKIENELAALKKKVA